MNGMSVLEQHTKVSAFIERWKDHGDEKQETQRFWIDLLQNVLGVEDALGSTMFEYKTVGGGFIDVLCTCNFKRFRFYDLDRDPRDV